MLVKQCKINKCLTLHKKGASRPTISNARSDRTLGRIIRKELFSTISQYTNYLKASGFEISRATTHKCMGSLKFVSRVPQKKPLLNPKQSLKRLNWAKCYQTKGSTFWNRVIFSDESSFTLSKSKKGNVWRKHGE